MATTDRPRLVVHVSIPRVPVAPEADAPDADDGGPVCGWFDSSWALRQGLAVQELGPAELPGDGSLSGLWPDAPGGSATPSATPSAAWQ